MQMWPASSWDSPDIVRHLTTDDGVHSINVAHMIMSCLQYKICMTPAIELNTNPL